MAQGIKLLSAPSFNFYMYTDLMQEFIARSLEIKFHLFLWFCNAQTPYEFHLQGTMQTAFCENSFTKNNYGEYIIFGRCPILTSILNRGSQSNLPNYRVATYDFHTFLYSTVASVVYQNTMDRSPPFLKSCWRLTNTISQVPDRYAQVRTCMMQTQLRGRNRFVRDRRNGFVYCVLRGPDNYFSRAVKKNALFESREFWNLSRNILYFEPKSPPETRGSIQNTSIILQRGLFSLQSTVAIRLLCEFDLRSWKCPDAQPTEYNATHGPLPSKISWNLHAL